LAAGGCTAGSGESICNSFSQSICSEYILQAEAGYLSLGNLLCGNCSRAEQSRASAAASESICSGYILQADAARFLAHGESTLQQLPHAERAPIGVTALLAWTQSPAGHMQLHGACGCLIENCAASRLAPLLHVLHVYVHAYIFIMHMPVPNLYTWTCGSRRCCCCRHIQNLLGFGSVSYYTMLRVPCPVVVVKQEDATD
jgi:hypothetical protein